MADHFPGDIRIGGPVPRACLKRLIRAIVAEGASLEGYGGLDATEESVRQAVCEGAIVRLYADQARYGAFEDLEAFLVRRRIHFDRYSEAYCEYNAEVVSYRGDKEAVVLPADQQGHVMLGWDEVKAVLDDKALSDSQKVEAIRRLVARPGTEPLAPIRFV